MPLYGWILIALGCVPLFMALRIATASIVAPPDAASAIATDGKARLLEGTRYMQYRVGIEIDAAAEVVWRLLTDAANYPEWNSTVISIDGSIAEGEKIALKAKVAPDRTFSLLVSKRTPTAMVWEDGNRIFRGVRTFTVTPTADGRSTVTMAEVLTGAFLPQIAPKLPDFHAPFETFVADLKRAAEA